MENPRLTRQMMARTIHVNTANKTVSTEACTLTVTFELLPDGRIVSGVGTGIGYTSTPGHPSALSSVCGTRFMVLLGPIPSEREFPRERWYKVRFRCDGEDRYLSTVKATTLVRAVTLAMAGYNEEYPDSDKEWITGGTYSVIVEYALPPDSK